MTIICKMMKPEISILKFSQQKKQLITSNNVVMVIMMMKLSSPDKCLVNLLKKNYLMLHQLLIGNHASKNYSIFDNFFNWCKC